MGVDRGMRGKRSDVGPPTYDDMKQADGWASARDKAN